MVYESISAVLLSPLASGREWVIEMGISAYSQAACVSFLLTLQFLYLVITFKCKINGIYFLVKFLHY